LECVLHFYNYTWDAVKLLLKLFGICIFIYVLYIAIKLLKTNLSFYIVSFILFLYWIIPRANLLIWDILLVPPYFVKSNQIEDNCDQTPTIGTLVASSIALRINQSKHPILLHNLLSDFLRDAAVNCSTLGAFHLVTQVDTSIVPSLLFIKCQKR